MQKHITLQQYFIKLSLTFTKHYAQLLQRFPLSSPPQTFCGRQRKAGVGLVAPGLRFWFFVFLFLVLAHPKFKVSIKNPTYYTTNSSSKIFPPAPEKQRLSGNASQAVFCGEDPPKKKTCMEAGREFWGALREQLSLGWGRRP